MRRPAWKGDPPRGPPRCADVGGGRALDRGGRADLRDSDDGGGGHAEGSRSEPRRSSAGCNRRGRGRSVCRWRRGSGNEGISPVAAPSAGDPRPAVRPDEDTAADAPGSRKTCDNPGWSSLCAFEDRGSSTRGLGASTPGPHWLLATVGQKRVRSHRTPSSQAGRATRVPPCRRRAPRLDPRSSAGRSPPGHRPLDQENPNPCPRGRPASAHGETFRKRHFYVIVNTSATAPGT